MIEAAGGTSFAIGANLDSLDGVGRFLEELDEVLTLRLGTNHFDILVNNAGIGTSSPFEETNEEELDRLMAVNVKAPFFLVQQSLGRLRNGGRIINISSGVTRIAFPHIMAYNLTKGALNTFTLHLAQLLGPRGITVNAVMPGIVDTDINASWLHTPEGRQNAEDMSALGRVGEPSDIADIVAFVASPDGRWVTGQMLDATGGSHL
jgi:NAD(P)-dependent dehydrogenase (short-subunit alcohol dehydrogenase family)